MASSSLPSNASSSMIDGKNEPVKFCKCGCGSPIAVSRVFVNRDHQLRWMRSEGAKRRQAKRMPAAADVSPVVRVEAVTPRVAPPSRASIDRCDRPPAPNTSTPPRGPAHIPPASLVPQPEGTDTPRLSVMGELYRLGFVVSAFPAFCLVWMYCIVAYGGAGAALGWLPAIVVSSVAGLAWPGLLAAFLAGLTQI